MVQFVFDHILKERIQILEKFSRSSTVLQKEKNIFIQTIRYRYPFREPDHLEEVPSCQHHLGIHCDGICWNHAVRQSTLSGLILHPLPHIMDPSKGLWSRSMIWGHLKAIYIFLNDTWKVFQVNVVMNYRQFLVLKCYKRFSFLKINNDNFLLNIYERFSFLKTNNATFLLDIYKNFLF